jgi:FkbM family methyltransferase
LNSAALLSHRLRNLLRRIGFDIRRYHPSSSQHSAMDLLLRHLRIDLVLDVGANTGQTGEELFRSGFAGRVVSFEPLASAHAELARKAAPHPRWIAHPRTAIGAGPGEVTIQVAANSVSSSILPMLQSHLDAASESRTVGSEAARIVRLDDVASPYMKDAKAVLLKVDTQGFEWDVLDGAEQTLQAVAAVQLELSLVPLYAGQRLWRDHADRMEGLGFQLYFAYPAFTDTRTGQTLQWDGMFVRQTLLAPSSSSDATPASGQVG